MNNWIFVLLISYGFSKIYSWLFDYCQLLLSYFCSI